MTLQENFEKIKSTVAAAAAKARRNPKEVTLVAVTKNASPEQIKQLVEMGQMDLAESRVQQLQQRAGPVEHQHGHTDPERFQADRGGHHQQRRDPHVE